MNNGELMELLMKAAKNYSKDSVASIKRNNHMNEVKKEEEINKRHIDAGLTDFLNYFAREHCGMDLAMYTEDLAMYTEDLAMYTEDLTKK